MKFGDHLQQEIFPPWRISYISYNALKKDLKSRQLDHQWNEKDENDFIEKLENELQKVYDFVTAKLSEVESRISYCERTIQTFSSNPLASTEENWKLMDEALTEVLFDVNDLAKFTRLNYIGFQKIIKKHDKWTKLNLTQDFIPQLRSKPLDKQRFDVAIVFISALHDVCKQRGKSRTSEILVDVNPYDNSTEANKVKYWIHPDNITEVKSIIMLHLPAYIPNKQKRYDAADTAVSNVYLESDQFGIYTGILQRDDNVGSINLKWHGSTANPNIFVERSVHNVDSKDGKVIKSQVQLMSDDVHKFITGALTANEFANRLRARGVDPKIVDNVQVLADEIQQSINENQLKPVCRVFYNRTIFQLPDDPKSRINIDSEVAFIREDNFNGTNRRGPQDWRRPDVGVDYPFNHVNPTDILHFPYAILETKVTKKSPKWLVNLLESHLVHEVPKFSKYLHGISYLFRDRLPLLPWWLSEMEIDIRKPRSTNFGLTRSKSFKPLIDGQYRRAMEEENLRMEFENDKDDLEQKLHRMRSTLVTKGDDPLHYGQKKKFRRREKQGEGLGEVIDFNNGDVRIEMADLGEKNKKIPGTNMYVRDPNDPNGTIPVKKVKIEPKVFFSNERTFIAWLQFCALLLSVALNLLNFGDSVSRIAGAIFIGISAGIAIYALYQFERRAWMINNRVIGRYDDLWGPAVLCVLLVGALVVNFYLRFR